MDSVCFGVLAHQQTNSSSHHLASPDSQHLQPSLVPLLVSASQTLYTTPTLLIPWPLSSFQCRTQMHWSVCSGLKGGSIKATSTSRSLGTVAWGGTCWSPLQTSPRTTSLMKVWKRQETNAGIPWDSIENNRGVLSMELEWNGNTVTFHTVVRDFFISLAPSIIYENYYVLLLHLSTEDLSGCGESVCARVCVCVRMCGS